MTTGPHPWDKQFGWQKCPCCLQPAEELRLLPENSMLPDEPICRDCFYEYRAQNDETEYNDLKKAEAGAT